MQRNITVDKSQVNTAISALVEEGLYDEVGEECTLQGDYQFYFDEDLEPLIIKCLQEYGITNYK